MTSSVWLKKILIGALIIGPVAVFFAFIFCLPMDQFVFRSWEAVKVQKKQLFAMGPFYRGVRLDRKEASDLASYRPYSELHETQWETDQYGYRNRPNLCENPQIIVMGDSNVAGSSLTQSDTLSEKLRQLTGQCVWNLGNADPENVLALLETLKLSPRIVVWALIERHWRSLEAFEEKQWLREKHKLKFLQWWPLAWADQFTRLNDFLKFNPFQAYKSRFGIVAAIHRAFVKKQAVDLTSDPSRGELFPAPAVADPPAMLFLKGAKFNETIPPVAGVADLARVTIDYFEKFSIKVVVAPLPEKETLYAELVPMKKTDTFYYGLLAEMASRKINVVDLLTPFRKAFEERGELAYHRYDTHWNRQGVNMAAQVLLPALLPP